MNINWDEMTYCIKCKEIVPLLDKVNHCRIKRHAYSYCKAIKGMDSSKSCIDKDILNTFEDFDEGNQKVGINTLATQTDYLNQVKALNNQRNIFERVDEYLMRSAGHLFNYKVSLG